MAGKLKYEIIIYWSAEDQAYVAEVPELPGCAAIACTVLALSTTATCSLDRLARPSLAHLPSRHGWR